MFDKRNRWLVSLVLVVAVISFAGIMVVLPFAGALQQENRASETPAPDATPSATPSPSSPEETQADLEAQARGYELVLEREPNNQTALRGLLDARIQMGDIEGTIEPLQRLAELNPDETDYIVLLAQAKQQLGDREGAAQSYRSILSTQPGNMNALQGLVQLLLDEQRPEAAIGLLQDTLQMADDANQVQAGSIDRISVQLLLGRVYAESERYDEAIAIYDEAIAGDTQDFRPLLAKGIILQALGRNDEAQPLFTSAEALAPAQYRDQIQQIASGQAPGQPPIEGANESNTPDASAESSESDTPDASAESTPAATPAATE